MNETINAHMSTMWKPPNQTWWHWLSIAVKIILASKKNDESCKRWNRELQRRGVAIKATCLKHGVKHPNINDSAPIDEELVLFDDKDWYLVEAQVTDRSD